MARLADDLPDRARNGFDENTRAFSLGRLSGEGAIVVAVDSGGVDGDDVEWYTPALVDGIRQAVTEARGADPRNRRFLPLIGVPFLGSGAGGGSRIKGDLLRSFFAVLDELAKELSVDIVFVARDVHVHAAAQQVRTSLNGSEAATAQIGEAKRLGELARRGSLVLFVGAGASIAAGLPGWGDLLVELTEGTAIDPEGRDFKELDPLDQAELIQRRLGEANFRRRMDEIFDVDDHSLVHQLLASLPTSQAATTNYDTLFEQAWEVHQDTTAVLPGGLAAGADRWLVKLHGSIDREDKPLVLRRSDYLNFDRGAGVAVSGLVQAMLMTRHMLFVGFSMTDDHFLRIVHDVRDAIGPADSRPTATFGTAVTPRGTGYGRELWADDVELLSFARDDGEAAANRHVEIFLDHVVAEATDPSSHLIDDSFAALWEPDEAALSAHLNRAASMVSELPESLLRARLVQVFAGLGAFRSR